MCEVEWNDMKEGWLFRLCELNLEKDILTHQSWTIHRTDYTYSQTLRHRYIQTDTRAEHGNEMENTASDFQWEWNWKLLVWFGTGHQSIYSFCFGLALCSPFLCSIFILMHNSSCTLSLCFLSPSSLVMFVELKRLPQQYIFTENRNFWFIPM